MQAPERKRLMSLLSLLLLAVGAPVGAFQCNVPSVSYSNTQSSRYFLVTNAMDTRQKCFSCLHARYRYKHLAFLAAAEDSTTDESTDVAKESKRRRFAKAIRKIITYPKEKVKKKLKSRQMSEDESHESSKAVSDSKDQVSNLQTETAVSDHAHDGKPSEESEDAATVEATATATNIHIGLGSNTSPAILTDTTKTEVPDDSKKSDTAKSKDNSSTRSRSATSTNTDLSGKWELNVSEDFKKDYDKYLQDLGQPALVRSVALSIIGMTAEEITQTNDGRELNIRGRNVRGNWERTLVTSTEDNPTIVPIVTADNEEVRSECWWEENSTVHRSWLRGVNKYGGGDFESKRYLDGDVLVCESVFHPKDKSKEKASVIWRFQKQN